MTSETLMMMMMLFTVRRANVLKVRIKSWQVSVAEWLARLTAV